MPSIILRRSGPFIPQTGCLHQSDYVRTRRRRTSLWSRAAQLGPTAPSHHEESPSKEILAISISLFVAIKKDLVGNICAAIDTVKVNYSARGVESDVAVENGVLPRPPDSSWSITQSHRHGARGAHRIGHTLRHNGAGQECRRSAQGQGVNEGDSRRRSHSAGRRRVRSIWSG